MTTISTINLMPSTKSEVEFFTKNAKEMILSGYENPLKIASQLKAMEDVIESLRSDKDIKKYTLKEAEKDGKSFKRYGAEFQVKEVGVKYDFSVCNDSTYNELALKMEALKAEIKDRETYLKSIKPGIEAVDTKTGELLCPPVKSSTTSVTVKLT